MSPCPPIKPPKIPVSNYTYETFSTLLVSMIWLERQWSYWSNKFLTFVSISSTNGTCLSISWTYWNNWLISSFLWQHNQIKLHEWPMNDQPHSYLQPNFSVYPIHLIWNQDLDPAVYIFNEMSVQNWKWYKAVAQSYHLP